MLLHKKHIPLLNKHRLTKKKVDSADIIYVMSADIKNEIIQKYEYPEAKIYNLNIPNRYWFPYAPKLIKEIKEALFEYE